MIFKNGKLSTVAMIIAVTLIMQGCFNSEVSIVKNGTLPFDDTITINRALTNFKLFNSVSWSTKESKSGSRFVIAKCSFNLDKFTSLKNYASLRKHVKNIYAVFMFSLHADGKKFNFAAENFEFTLMDESKEKEILTIAHKKWPSLNDSPEYLAVVYKNDLPLGLEWGNQLLFGIVEMCLSAESKQ